ncbi:hypothetical protein ABPG77_005576 [Micractinium sp. CCAP 211/92]
MQAQVAVIPQRYRPDAQKAEEAVQAAAGAAAGLDQKFGELKKAAKNAYDRIYYGDVLPPVGSFQISYARMLQLLHERRVKRLILLSDGRTAIVEVPVENTESDFDTVTYNRRDLSIQYANEVPEWKMEKNRYYVELPGDVWEEGTLMQLIKDNQEKRVYIDGVLRVPYDNMLKVHQVRPELQVVDPGNALVWLNEYSSQFLPIVGLLGLRMVVGVGEWVLKKMGREKKSEQEQLAEELGRHRAKEFNAPADGKKKGARTKGTGVKYDDVAGIDHIKQDIREVLDILLGDEAYLSMGARPIRGVLLEGPPGTGKTLLAKAMAGEAGIPFYSANGAEFVEMFQGVAAARIRSLFKTARKNAPAIIFIDEIDAIGKARSSGFTDSGTQEREQGLLQLLTEMDGFYRDDQVLVVAATNRADALDDALLRPGRFDRTIYMGRPAPSNRLKILQVHARNKPIDRSNDDALLRQIADLSIGYSGAELANLLNEAAILAVRQNKAEIDLSILKEAMDKVRLGLPHQSLPDSAAKQQYAAIEAARAVAFALTPGLPPIEHVTIRPRGGTITRILFVPQEFGKDGGMWHQLATPGAAANAVELDRPLSQLEVACGLLAPLYAARACEEVLFGPQAVSLSTSKEVARAGELARWIVMDSGLHPATRDDLVLVNMQPGGVQDPTTKWAGPVYDDLILDLQQRAYEAALRMVSQRRSVIRQVARELCENSDETVLGKRIVELLKSTPLDEPEAGDGLPSSSSSSSLPGSSNGAAASPAAAAGTQQQQQPQSDGQQQQQDAQQPAAAAAQQQQQVGGAAAAREELGPEIAEDANLVRLAEVVMGRVEEWDLLPGAKARSKAQRVREQLLDPAQRQRLEAIRRFGDAPPGDAPFPPPPVPAASSAAGEAAAAAPAEQQGTDDFLPRSAEVVNI